MAVGDSYYGCRWGYSTTDDVISMGGRGKGVDTAILLRAAHQNSFFDLKIKEILCLPREEKT